MVSTASRPKGILLPDGTPLRPSNFPRAVRADLPLLEGVISGGQIGVDQASLHVARDLGLATGGYAPLGFRTLRGPESSLGYDFGLIECGDESYASRTARNVAAAGATLRIAHDFLSPGEVCTLKAIKKYGKPHHDVPVDERWKERVDALLAFLRDHRVRVLNVAGNATLAAGRHAEAFLLRALSQAWVQS